MSHQPDYMVIGRDSFLGSSIVEYLKEEPGRIYTSSRRMDISSPLCVYLDMAGNVSELEIPKSVGKVFLCAAITSLDECRRSPEESRRINVDNTVKLAARFIEQGVSVVFPSTNLVFDGQSPSRRANEAMCPVTEYGRSKAVAERELMSLGKEISIVRFTKIIGPDMPLINDWIGKLRNKMTIYPFLDMVLSPVSVGFASKAIVEIGKKKLGGIWQVSAKQDITYEQLALHLAMKINKSPKYVEAVSVKDSGIELEGIPKHTTLDISRIENDLNLASPDIWESLGSVFRL